jgi:RNA recognition motif-containing protein
MNIYVGNLSSDVSDSDLEKAFSKFGKVSSAKVIRDMFSRESRGFGFVEMPGNTEAASAIEKLNASELKGKNIIVNEAKPKRGGSRGGGSRNRRY